MQYADYSTRELQASLTPDQVVQILRDGNERFRTGQPLTRDLTRQREATAETRHPLAIVLSGASSRTPVEMIFDMGLGDIFCARVTGNLVSVGVLGSLEYACAVAGAKLILVLGHANSEVMRMAVEAFLSRQRVADTTGCTHLDPIVAEVQKSIDPHRFTNWQSLPPQEQQARLDELYRAAHSPRHRPDPAGKHGPPASRPGRTTQGRRRHVRRAHRTRSISSSLPTAW